MTALASICFAVGYLLVYAAVYRRPGDKHGGHYATNPWAALFEKNEPGS